MNRVTVVPRTVRVLASALLLTCVSLAFAGCKEEAQRYSIIITSDEASLFRDGSDQATLTVTLLDQDGSPPAIGSTFTVVAAQGGLLAEASAQFGQFQTDPTGSGTVSVRCDDTADFAVIQASFDGEAETIVLPCTAPPSGAWRIEYVGSTPSVLSEGTTGQLTFRATTETGAPVPVDTRIAVNVLGGSVVLGTGSDEAIVATRSGDGTVSIPVRVPEVLTPSTVCASFLDARLGTNDGCAIIGPASRSCTGVFSPQSIPSDGQSITQVTYTVIDSFGSPVPNAAVEVVLSEPGQNGPRLVENRAGDGEDTSKSLTTGNDGQASTFVRAGTESGSGTINATATFEDINEETGAVEAFSIACEYSNFVTFEPVPECFFQPIEILNGERLGTSGSPFAQSATVRACFRDLDGNPVAAGQTVEFSVPTAPPGYVVNPSSRRTGIDGCASTLLRTGERGATLRVKAVLGDGDFASECTSSQIEVQSGRPVTTGWSITCDQRNVGALIGAEAGTIPAFCEMPCQTLLVDSGGNRVDADAYPISFLAEQGAISDASFPENGGIIRFTHQVHGELPFTGSQTAPGEQCNGLDNCQTDGLMSFIAYVDGEETFCDSNVNGVYDEGEAFEDLGEPWIDIDENGVFDQGRDRFIDLVGPDRERNGVWDGPNRQWDLDTKIFAAGHMLFTGPTEFYNAGTGPVLAGTPITVPSVTGSGVLNLELLDANLNPTSPVTTITSDIECDGDDDGNLTVTLVGGDQFPFTVRRERVHFDASNNQISGLDASQTCTDQRVARWETRYVVDHAQRSPRSGVGPTLQVEYERDGPDYRCSGTIAVTQEVANGCDFNYEFTTRIGIQWR